jgi:SAM-dependent methyltransferase
MNGVRSALKSVLPSGLIELARAARLKRLHARFRGLKPSEAFSIIYSEGLWGRSGESTHHFNSGIGSHDQEIVAAYVSAVTMWLGAFPCKPDVADVGCGDFRVGSPIRPFCGRYLAYDCVPSLVASNRSRWASADVEFAVLDISRDAPAQADIVFVRQVFQHLPNDLIEQALARLANACTWLVVTEDLPDGRFVANIDKAIGPDIRCTSGSGVVLTDPPFSLKPAEELQLCRVSSAPGSIVTTAYRLK